MALYSLSYVYSKIVSVPQESQDKSSVPQPDSSELSNLLLNYLPKTTRPDEKRIKLDSGLPSTIGSSQLFKVHVATQCQVKMKDKSTNFKSRKTVSVASRPENESSSFHSEEISRASTETTPSLFTPSLFGTTETDEEAMEHTKKEYLSRNIILEKINNKPKLYLGLPKQYLWLLNYIAEKNESEIDPLCLIVALFKIKQNYCMERMNDQFQLSRTKLSNMVLLGIEALANFFQNLIVFPEQKIIKQNLPLVFKIRYSNVQMIIDCFEIQMSKPSNPLKQAQTWSQYKSCNTVKYLIGCTPNGLVSFISEGYGGRISDKAIVEKSNLIGVLPHNVIVLADRGFKEVESLFSSHGVKLLRPPTVYAGVKQTLIEAQKSKVIASLRVHVERVIKRVREFALLKPHSVVHYKYVPYLDEAVIIACGLINLQGEIIKSF